MRNIVEIFVKDVCMDDRNCRERVELLNIETLNIMRKHGQMLCFPYSPFDVT
jgi:hypothetical protein